MRRATQRPAPTQPPAAGLLPSPLRPRPSSSPTTSVCLVAWETAYFRSRSCGPGEMAEERHPTVSTGSIPCRGRQAGLDGAGPHGSGPAERRGRRSAALVFRSRPWTSAEAAGRDSRRREAGASSGKWFAWRRAEFFAAVSPWLLLGSPKRKRGVFIEKKIGSFLPAFLPSHWVWKGTNHHLCRGRQFLLIPGLGIECDEAWKH